LAGPRNYRRVQNPYTQKIDELNESRWRARCKNPRSALALVELESNFRALPLVQQESSEGWNFRNISTVSPHRRRGDANESFASTWR
jgi:hypothetical protein